MAQDLDSEARAQRLLFWAATLSVVAGLVHGAVTPEHLTEWWGYGVFFVFAAIAQVMYGLVLFIRPWRYDETGGIRADAERYARPVYLTGIAGNVSIVLLYLVTRTAGIPFLGPEAGQVEPVTLISLVSKVVELALIGCLVVLLRYLDRSDNQTLAVQ